MLSMTLVRILIIEEYDVCAIAVDVHKEIKVIFTVGITITAKFCLCRLLNSGQSYEFALEVVKYCCTTVPRMGCVDPTPLRVKHEIVESEIQVDD